MSDEMCPLAENDFDFNYLTLESEDDSSWIESVNMNQWKTHFKFSELLVEMIIEDLIGNTFSPSRQPEDESFILEYHKYMHSKEPVSSESENNCYSNLPGTKLEFGVDASRPQL